MINGTKYLAIKYLFLSTVVVERRTFFMEHTRKVFLGN